MSESRKSSASITPPPAALDKRNTLIEDDDDDYDDDEVIAVTATDVDNTTTTTEVQKKRTNPRIAKMKKRWSTVRDAKPLLLFLSKNDPVPKTVDDEEDIINSNDNNNNNTTNNNTNKDDVAYNIATNLRNYFTPKQGTNSKQQQQQHHEQDNSNDNNDNNNNIIDDDDDEDNLIVVASKKNPHVEAFKFLSRYPGGADLETAPPEILESMPNKETARAAKAAHKKYLNAGWRLLTYDEIALTKTKKKGANKNSRKRNSAEGSEDSSAGAADGAAAGAAAGTVERKRRGGIDEKRPISVELQKFLQLPAPEAQWTQCVSDVIQYFKIHNLVDEKDSRLFKWDDNVRDLLRPLPGCTCQKSLSIFEGKRPLSKFSIHVLLKRHTGSNLRNATSSLSSSA